jgi:hypothetical protein
VAKRHGCVQALNSIQFRLLLILKIIQRTLSPDVHWAVKDKDKFSLVTNHSLKLES